MLLLSYTAKVIIMKEPDNGVITPYFAKAELRVMEMLVRGYSEKEAAERLHLSAHTVNNHLRHIRERHHVTKNTEVLLLYIAYLRKQSFSLRKLRELGLSAILIFVNVCQYTGTHL